MTLVSNMKKKKRILTNIYVRKEKKIETAKHESIEANLYGVINLHHLTHIVYGCLVHFGYVSYTVQRIHHKNALKCVHKM